MSWFIPVATTGRTSFGGAARIGSQATLSERGPKKDLITITRVILARKMSNAYIIRRLFGNRAQELAVQKFYAKQGIL